MNSKQIQNLLAERHKDDVFVPECNLGSAWDRCTRMDAWAMKKSWSQPNVFGYEIKVSRGDFLRDEKWHNYLPYCNQFAWVCPWGLIQPQEVGEGAGLIYVTKTGTKLITKVKPVRREVEIPDDVYRYVLMSRARIVRDMHESNVESRREFWERWLEKREVDRGFGHMVGGAIGRAVREKIKAVEAENRALKHENECFERVRETMDELGLTPGRWLGKHTIEDRVNEMNRLIPDELRSRLAACSSAIDRALKELESTESGGAA